MAEIVETFSDISVGLDGYDGPQNVVTDINERIAKFQVSNEIRYTLFRDLSSSVDVLHDGPPL